MLNWMLIMKFKAKVKDKNSKILNVIIFTLLLMPCDFFPFAYLETENDMTKTPLGVWFTIKLLMFLNSILVT